MIASIVALGVLIPAQDAVPVAKPKASALIGAMFQYYANAQTLTGRIHHTEYAMNKSLSVDTELAYERPSLIFLDQKKTDGKPYYDGTPSRALLVSDGVQFKYTAPRSLGTGISMLKESVQPTAKIKLSIGEMFGTLKGFLGKSLGDDSFPLNCVIARQLDLKSLLKHLASFSFKGRVALNGQTVNEIDGDWQESFAKASGTFQLFINDQNEIVRFATVMNYVVNAQYLVTQHLPANAYPEGVKVESVWDCTFKTDVPIEHKIFRLPD